MTSPSRILVATDLSPPSLHAVQRGLQLAQAAAAQCTVLHALELDALDALRDMLHGDTTDLARKITEEARLRLTQIVQDPLRYPGVKPASTSPRSPPWRRFRHRLTPCRPTWWCWVRAAAASCATCCPAPLPPISCAS